jgi:hypothetical protein
MKNDMNHLIYPFAIIVMFILFANSCSNDEKNNPTLALPILTTSALSDVTPNTANCGGTITSDGGSAIIARGVCWCTGKTLPTIDDSKSSDGSGAGTFKSTLTFGSIPPDPDEIEYFVRAYATNSNGTGYGNTLSFKTGSSATVPIDGGLGFLLFGGLIYGVYKFLKSRKS